MGMIKKTTSAIPTIPTVPITTLGSTPAQGGIAPVKPANKSDGSEEKVKFWEAKDKSIETQAILKSVLESPAFAQLSVGRSEKDVLDIGTRMFNHFLGVFKAAKNA